MNLDVLNALPDDEAHESFYRCCASDHWAAQMTEARPFDDEEVLLETADKLWWDLSAEHWLEAFEGHPKIGDVDSLREKYGASRSWSEGEQRGVQGADDEVLQKLADLNDAYEEKFGFIFIVCATGKSAREMLRILENRIQNDPDEELQNAAGEQAKITAIRLEKLLQDGRRR